MIEVSQPSKYLVRAYLARRAHDAKPPPSPEEIRRQLGWGLSAADAKIVIARRV